MKYLYVMILLFTTTDSLKNKLDTSSKICKDCKYFIANEKKCKYFNDIDLVTGDKTYKYASIMRNNECGKDAKYFEENKIKFITVPYYFLKDYWTLIPTVLFTLVYVTVMVIKK